MAGSPSYSDRPEAELPQTPGAVMPRPLFLQSVGINTQMHLAPLTAALCAMLLGFPLAFAQGLDARGVSEHVRALAAWTVVHLDHLMVGKTGWRHLRRCDCGHACRLEGPTTACPCPARWSSRPGPSMLRCMPSSLWCGNACAPSSIHSSGEPAALQRWSGATTPHGLKNCNNPADKNRAAHHE